MKQPTPEEWDTLDAFIGPTWEDEALALADVAERLLALEAEAAPRIVMRLRACALAVAVIVRRLEVRGVATDLMGAAQTPERP